MPTDFLRDYMVENGERTRYRVLFCAAKRVSQSMPPLTASRLGPLLHPGHTHDVRPDGKDGRS